MNKSDKFNILLIEQSDNLRTVLKDFLEMKQFEVKDFEEGNQALKALSKTHFDICLLDLQATPVNGFFLIQELKKVDSSLPIVFISSRNDKETRIQGFKLGCDDFITKPFSIEELELRLEAILRRTADKKNILEKSHELIYYFTNFKFNYTALELSNQKKTIHLTRKEADMLKMFCTNVNVLVPRQRFVKEIWGDAKSQIGRSMDVYITRLRKFLSDDQPATSQLKSNSLPPVEIINVHGTGYIFRINE
ncbi:MAG TPA: response regulator transcription factor [Bacteroidales bacterium]|nr:response regulator transcription factor [Bacteroidales bacterium]